jgi:hypothetical protein
MAADRFVWHVVDCPRAFPPATFWRGDHNMNRNVAAVSAAVVTCAAAASGGLMPFTADISGAASVPPNASPATGFMLGSYDDVANAFTFNWSITDNLVGTPAAPGAHIHAGASDATGPIVFSFADGPWERSGSATWENLTQDHLDALFSGDLYINFHTDAFPAGEVRGQIRVVPAPGAVGLMAAGMIVALRRRA